MPIALRGRRRRPASAGRVLEKTEQFHIQSLLASLGGAVYVLGTRRRRGKPCPSCGTFVPEDQGTRQTPGIADLVAFLPSKRPAGETPRRVLLFIECKAEGGRLSPEQIVFRHLCHDAEIAHVVGTYNAVIAWLMDRQYLKPDAVPHYRQPKADLQACTHDS
jgi:hypothetical protein